MPPRLSSLPIELIHSKPFGIEDVVQIMNIAFKTAVVRNDDLLDKSLSLQITHVRFLSRLENL